MTFTAVGSPFAGTSSSLTVSPVNTGDLILVEIICESTSIVYCDGISGGNCTWEQVTPSFGGTYSPCCAVVWAGTSYATGSSTATLSFTATLPGNLRIAGQEFSSTVGTWHLDVSGNLDSGATAFFPALTPAAPGELYFCFCYFGISYAAGSTPGYTYFIDPESNGLAFNPDCTSATQQPVWGTGSGSDLGIAVLMSDETLLPVFAQNVDPAPMPPGWFPAAPATPNGVPFEPWPVSTDVETPVYNGIRVVQAAQITGASGNFPLAVTAGNAIVLIPSAYASSGTISFSAPAYGGGVPVTLLSFPFTQSPVAGGGTVEQYVYVLAGVPGGSTAVSVTVSGTAFDLKAYEVYGLGSYPYLDTPAQALATGNNTANPSAGPAGATTEPNELIVGSAIGYFLTSATPGYPWTSILSDPSFYAWSGVQIAAGSQGQTYSWAQSSVGTAAWTAGIVTIAAGLSPVMAADPGMPPGPFVFGPGWFPGAPEGPEVTPFYLPPADNEAVAQATVTPVTQADAAGAVDALASPAAVPAADVAGAADALPVTVTATAADVAGAADTLAVTVIAPLPDAGGAVEAPAVIVTAPLADAAGAADTIPARGIALSDTAGAVDTLVTPTRATAMSDVAGAVDSASESGGASPVPQADTAGAADTLVISAVMPILADEGAAADTLAYLVGITAGDAAGAADKLAISGTGSSSVTMTDTAGAAETAAGPGLIPVTMTDTAGAADFYSAVTTTVTLPGLAPADSAGAWDVLIYTVKPTIALPWGLIAVEDGPATNVITLRAADVANYGVTAGQQFQMYSGNPVTIPLSGISAPVARLNQNCSFETGTTPWTATGGAVIAQSLLYPWALDLGTHSCSVTPNGTTSQPGMISETITLPGGGYEYIATGSVTASAAWSAGVSVGINWYGPSGLISASLASSGALAATTQVVTIMPQTYPPAGATGAAVFATAAGTPPASTVFYWDFVYEALYNALMNAGQVYTITNVGTPAFGLVNVTFTPAAPAVPYLGTVAEQIT